MAGTDLISRQGAIDAISTWDKFGVDERNRVVRWHEGLEPYVKLRDVVWAIEKLPSEERKGKWRRTYLDHEAMGIRPSILYCSECQQCIAYPTNYCPNCGARMVSEDER